MNIRTIQNNLTVCAFDNGAEIAYSYETPVAGFSPGLGYFRTSQKFSVTTSRHVNKYLGATCGKVTTLEQAAIAAFAASVAPHDIGAGL